MPEPSTSRADRPAPVDPTTLAQALDQAADALEGVLERATTAHLQLGRAVEADRSWAHPGDALADEVRSRRTDVGLYAAALLVDQLREEARAAQERFPRLGVTGERVLPLPAEETPAAVAAWWAGLADTDREQVLTRHAAWAGRTDGLPCAVRHRANLQVLDAEIARRSHLLQHDPSAPTDEATVEEVRDLRGLLKLKAIFTGPEALDDPPAGLEQVTTPFADRYLYLLDARAYPLRTAIALGDPDRATHVVVHVPGTTTSVDVRVLREAAWTSWLRDETVRLAAGRDPEAAQHVCVLDWIGYQAPYDITTRQSLGDTGLSVLVPGEASDPRYAEAAAPALARCVEGLVAVTPEGVRVVASGHSYGASAMGCALRVLARDGQHLVDAAVTAGAPGVFASTLAELGLPDGALYACVAPADLIGLLGVFGEEVLRIPGVRQVSTGARRVTYPDGATAWLRPPVGHEQYYHRGTTSLLGIAAAVADDQERLRTSRPWLSRSGSSDDR